MKFIKNHLMFILPLMAILLGIEFFLVFDRTTNSYAKSLREGYSMFVVSKEAMNLEDFQGLNKHIISLEAIERENILSDVMKDMSENTNKEIIKSLPYFYNLSLDAYLNNSGLEEIKKSLEEDARVSFIKFTLNIFIFFMAVVSLFLIIKQMEIWKYAQLRSGVLFKVALFDAFITDAIVTVAVYSVVFSSNGVQE